MIKIPLHLHPHTDPVALPETQAQFPGARVTVIFDRLLRIEISPDETFDDRASQVFQFRRQPLTSFDIAKFKGVFEVSTKHLCLQINTASFDVHTPKLFLRFRDQERVWVVEEPDPGNLLGTARTLDNVDGPVSLGRGLMSRSGWSLVDDTESLVFNDAGWLEPRQASPGYRDLYLFAYGSDYQACLKEFYRISGRTPMLPRWALGNWWSRYWAYSQEELLALMDQFRERETPLSVCVVDMDWHLVDIGPSGGGWTGYTWNRDLFPEPENFIDQLHRRGLKTCLNLHPALGVRPHEEQYGKFAERLGLDPDSKQDIPFNIANVAFADAYLELLHHPEEERGVDFWWIDWQQGEESEIPGLDPLWMLNHLHYLDLARDGENRALILSRWGGLGSHRYPVGFSGDAHVTWDSLGFQPYFTAAAANVGYGWWSHDIGGHMMGIEDSELYARWMQYGVFSPIFRMHSTNNPFQERRPWKYDAETYKIASDAMRMRHALIPYLYTMAWRNWRDGRPIIQPMYHYYPESEEAYFCPQQYMFGDKLMAAPFVTPMDPETRMSRRIVWFPPGGWYNFFTGEYFEGDRWQAIYGKLEEIPVFAPAGAIIPMGTSVGWGGIEPPDHFDLFLFNGSGGQFTLYEDDGSTLAYQRDECCLTEIRFQVSGRELEVHIIPKGREPGVCIEERSYTIHIFGAAAPEYLELTVNDELRACNWTYDGEKEKAVIILPSYDLADHIHLRLGASTENLEKHRSRTLEKCLELVRSFRLEPETKRAINLALEEIINQPPTLLPFTVNMTERQVQALLETIVQAGLELQGLFDHGTKLLMWNNNEIDEVVFRLAAEDRKYWDSARRFSSTSIRGARSTALTPPPRWKAELDYYGLFRRRLSSD